MSARRVQIVILCEDRQQSAFITRFLGGMGWDTTQLLVKNSPVASGSAEQWVREEFPNELKKYRQRQTQAASALIAVIDADLRNVPDRINDFKEECGKKGVLFRQDGERVGFAIPKRNIETWIHYLNGEQVDEQVPYPKLARERQCKPAVNELVRLCRTMGLPEKAPTSIKAACEEYNTRISPIR